MSNQEITVVCAECKSTFTTTKPELEYAIEKLCSEECRAKGFGRRGLGKSIDMCNTETRLVGNIYEKQDALSREDFLLAQKAQRQSRIKSLMLGI